MTITSFAERPTFTVKFATQLLSRAHRNWWFSRRNVPDFARVRSTTGPCFRADGVGPRHGFVADRVNNLIAPIIHVPNIILMDRITF